MARVLVPLPDRDFDVTEVAVPWHVLTRAGHEVVFATERGGTPACDPLLIDGVIFGMLGADARAIELYRAMERAPSFRSPIRWDQASGDGAGSFDALLLAGGHAKGMRQYLAGERVHGIAAAAHGVRRTTASSSSTSI